MSRLEDEIAALRASYYAERENRDVLRIVGDEIGSTVQQSDELLMNLRTHGQRNLLVRTHAKRQDARFDEDFKLTGFGDFK